jgi:hypothetical protein
MYSFNTGQCQSYNAATNIATPFYRTGCFEPAYKTTLRDQLSNEPVSFYDAPFNSFNNPQDFNFQSNYGNGTSNPVHPLSSNYSAFDSRNNVYRREHSQIVGKAPRNYQTPTGEKCPNQPYYVEDEPGKPKKVVCPILDSHSVQPQCKTCLTTLFQCDRFRYSHPDIYRQCKEYQSMIYFDMVTPIGQFIPLGYEMDGEGYNVYKTAVQKCGFACLECTLNSGICQKSS